MEEVQIADAIELTVADVHIGNLTDKGVVCEIYKDYFTVQSEDGKEVSSEDCVIFSVPLTKEYMLSVGFEIIPVDIQLRKRRFQRWIPQMNPAGHATKRQYQHFPTPAN